jgi:hypothetical protein
VKRNRNVTLGDLKVISKSSLHLCLAHRIISRGSGTPPAAHKGFTWAASPWSFGSLHWTHCPLSMNPGHLEAVHTCLSLFLEHHMIFQGRGLSPCPQVLFLTESDAFSLHSIIRKSFEKSVDTFQSIRDRYKLV